MNLRENISKEKAWAHAVLDDVRDGIPTLDRDVRAALRILGEL